MLTIIFTCLVICFIGYLLNKEIHHLEFVALCLGSVIISCIVFALTNIPVANDVYYQSGRFNQVSYHPYFVEEYEQRHEETYACGKDDEGNTEYCTRVYYTTEHDTHYPYYLVKDTLGQAAKIDKSQYEQIANEFGGNLRIDRTCRFNHSEQKRVRGDSNLYYYNNDVNSFKYPTTAFGHWHNPLKKSKSIFNQEKDTILSYPGRYSWLNNNRMTTGKLNFGKKDLDILNTKLYETVGANVILLQVNSLQDVNDIKYGWNSGKKNDIVIAFGGNATNPDFVKVFGWYKSEILSTKLETEILDNGLNLDKIQHIILSYYEPFDFSQFKYLGFKQPELWQLIVTAIITIIALVVGYMCCCDNDLNRY